jgi:hypothetical protein
VDTGDAGAPDDGETLTPAPVPAVTATPVPLPPGVTTGGVADADALLDAHRAALRDRSYTLDVRVTVDGATSRRTARVESPTRYYQREALARQEVTVTRFASDRTVYTRSASATLTRYDRFDTVRPPGSQTVRESRVLLSVGNATVFETAVDGRPAFVVRGSYPVHPAAPALTNVTLRAVVEPGGLVRSFTVEYVRRDGGDRSNVIREFTYSDIGATTVERPAWVNREFNVTTDRP